MSCNSGLLALTYQLTTYHPYVYWALEKKCNFNSYEPNILPRRANKRLTEQYYV